MRSEWSARLVQIFCPSTTQPLPLRRARVRSERVSLPLWGSVTPKACRRRSPRAMAGSQRRFWASLPCRSRVPMMYIWAWQAAALQPLAWMVSSTTLAARSGRPLPP